MALVNVKYRVTYVESERGWGQKYDYADFDTKKEAEEFRDEMNAQNTGGVVPNWYMAADEKIQIIEVK